ncbi:MAG: hypothetical protein ACRDRR_21515 [Pseudonocardiaceae bacterium]
MTTSRTLIARIGRGAGRPGRELDSSDVLVGKNVPGVEFTGTGDVA